MEFLSQPWPWYIAGPLIGLTVPVLLIVGNRMFGISATLRHICAACIPAGISFLKYDWKAEAWSLVFLAGIVVGGYAAATFIPNPETVAISSGARAALQELGITDQSGLVPAQIFSWDMLLTPHGILLVVVGGFLVGFGARYAGGCTSGHAIMGLSCLEWPSLIAVMSFFAGGLFITHVVFPLIF